MLAVEGETKTGEQQQGKEEGLRLRGRRCVGGGTEINQIIQSRRIGGAIYHRHRSPFFSARLSCITSVSKPEPAGYVGMRMGSDCSLAATTEEELNQPGRRGTAACGRGRFEICQE